MENFSWKRLLAIGGFLVLVFLLAYLLYRLFFGPTTTDSPPTTTTPVTGGGLPTVLPGEPNVVEPGGSGLPTSTTPTTPPAPAAVADGGITEATRLATNASHTTSDGRDVLYYQSNDGKFYRTTADGNTEALSDQVFFNVEAVTWSPSRGQAVLEYPDGSNIVYNFQTQAQVSLPKHWEEFSFNPAGDQLAFKSQGVDRDSRWLGVSTTNGGQAQAVQPLGDNGSRVSVDWSPNQQVVATYRESTGADRQEIYFIGLNGENFRSLTSPGVGFQSQWTPDGNQLLFSASSAASGYRPLLWIADANGDTIGQNRRSLELNTWAEKCAFQSAQSLVCAVPQSLVEGSGLVPGVASTTPDDLYRINLTTGEKSLLARPNVNISAQDIFVSADGRAVFLEDGPSGQIYKIAL